MARRPLPLYDVVFIDKRTDQVVRDWYEYFRDLDTTVKAPPPPPTLSAQAFAALPATPSEGTIAYITDCTTVTWGATAAGGGTNKVLAWYRGGAWRVFAI
jgi:hypothetical protein